MSRIEIPLDEYNFFIDRIKELEKALNDEKKKTTKYEAKLKETEELVSELKDYTLLDRMFQWKMIREPLENLYGK